MPSEFLAEKPFFRIRGGSNLRLPIEEVVRATIGLLGHWRLIFATASSAAQMVERHICHDPVEPRVKTAFESEPVQAPVNAQETLLVDVTGVFLAVDQVDR